MKKNRDRLNILFEDKHLIVVYKNANLPTINSDKYSNSLYSEVFDYLHKKNHKIFVVHRLDKDTSGLVVFAKSERVKNELQNNWDKVTRNYLTIVHGQTKESGVIESYIKETKTLLCYSTHDKSGLYAKTCYKKLDSNNQYTLLSINIVTGRKNQIRLHMSDNNTPILGDRKYGKKDGYRNMMLLANELIFTHPITHEEININIGIPNEYKKIFEKKTPNNELHPLE